MNREFTCIVCPNGCRIDVSYELAEEKPHILSVSGNLCRRGKEYVEQELISPMRTIATSVVVEGGILPLTSVRLTRPVPKDKIPDVMNELRKMTVTAPVKAKTVLIENILGLDSDVIITKNVAAAGLGTDSPE